MVASPLLADENANANANACSSLQHLDFVSEGLITFKGRTPRKFLIGALEEEVHW